LELKAVLSNLPTCSAEKPMSAKLRELNQFCHFIAGMEQFMSQELNSPNLLPFFTAKFSPNFDLKN
jgi:hypothetical protein